MTFQTLHFHLKLSWEVELDGSIPPTKNIVSKTERQRRMFMKLGFRFIFFFLVNTKKQRMLPEKEMIS